MRAGLDYQSVGYRGVAPALADLLAGSIHFTNPSILAVKQHIDAGKMRGIAVTGTQRLPQAPQVPTFAESCVNVTPMANGTWWGLFAPAGTPPEVVNVVSQALRRALADPDTRKKMEVAAYGADWASPEEFAADLRREESVWKDFAPRFRK